MSSCCGHGLKTDDCKCSHFDGENDPDVTKRSEWSQLYHDIVDCATWSYSCVRRPVCGRPPHTERFCELFIAHRNYELIIAMNDNIPNTK